jgi:hypothetical protein
MPQTEEEKKAAALEEAKKSSVPALQGSNTAAIYGGLFDAQALNEVRSSRFGDYYFHGFSQPVPELPYKRPIPAVDFGQFNGVMNNHCNVKRARYEETGHATMPQITPEIGFL